MTVAEEIRSQFQDLDVSVAAGSISDVWGVFIILGQFLVNVCVFTQINQVEEISEDLLLRI